MSNKWLSSIHGYGLNGAALESAVEAVRSSPEGWVRFMMREELGLEEPDPRRTLVALLVVGGAKSRFTGVPVLRGAIQTALVGGIAAGVAHALARLVSQLGG